MRIRLMEPPAGCKSVQRLLLVQGSDSVYDPVRRRSIVNLSSVQALATTGQVAPYPLPKEESFL